MDYGFWLLLGGGRGHNHDFHGPFDQVMAFFFYLPNLLIVEAFIRAKSAASPEDTATLRRGIGGEPGTLDPGAAADSFSLEVLGDLYEGLTAESADGTVVPGVAASWTVDRTGAKYEFNLRHDAHWSNGAPVRAQDFVNAWRRVVDPKQGSSVADNLRVTPVRGCPPNPDIQATSTFGHLRILSLTSARK